MSKYRTVNVLKLSPGDKLVEPVFTEGLTKLIGSGCSVNNELIERLAERGVTEVVIQIPSEHSDKHPRRTAPAANARPTRVASGSRLIEHACQCGSVMAIHPPTAELLAAAWICTSCGAVYFGDFDDTKIRGVELLVANDNNFHLAEGYVETLCGTLTAKHNVKNNGSLSSAGRERRLQTRYSIGVEVVAIPLHADFAIAGPAVRMTTRDISSSGVALSCARFTNAPYFAIDFTSAGIELLQVLLQVVRVSNNGPNYEVAGKFISRLHCASPRPSQCSTSA